jgi:hypothetical protein
MLSRTGASRLAHEDRLDLAGEAFARGGQTRELDREVADLRSEGEIKSRHDK